LSAPAEHSGDGALDRFNTRDPNEIQSGVVAAAVQIADGTDLYV
jgi:hypothetical protein